MRNFSKLFLLLIFILVTLSCEMSIGGHVWIRDTSLIFTPTELPDAKVGQQYDVTITISNNDTPVSMIYGDEAELPPGLHINYVENTSTAVLSGVPEIDGEYKFIITAHCLGTNKTGQHGKQEYRLVIHKLPMPSITPPFAPIAPATLAHSPVIMIE